jgi:hypothetical protein
MGTGSKFASSAKTHPFQPVKKAGDLVSLANRPDRFLVLNQKFSALELDIV